MIKKLLRLGQKNSYPPLPEWVTQTHWVWHGGYKPPTVKMRLRALWMSVLQLRRGKIKPEVIEKIPSPQWNDGTLEALESEGLLEETEKVIKLQDEDDEE
jgi:hypothetical protein